MNQFITGNDINQINIIVSVIIAFAIVFAFHKISIRLFISKLNKAIDSNDYKSACEMLKIALEKHPRDKRIKLAYEDFAARFELQENRR